MFQKQVNDHNVLPRCRQIAGLLLLGVSLGMVSGCSGSSFEHDQAGSEKPAKLAAIKGEGVVVSVLELTEGGQEIGVELVDGRIVPARVDSAEQYGLGEKVSIARNAAGQSQIKRLSSK